jgi:hypothetical protein
MHGLVPALHDTPQVKPSQVVLPPLMGGHGTQAVPHDSGDLSSRHRSLHE